ncbi:MAG: PilT/PilU family type 4a pilus ATPase [candidate division Zixibacteria bacterium]|nr:PilT/PilU family type 4a pilus ATPase [candidate division Zixibacteria bacterium]
MNLRQLLAEMQQRRASDLHLRVGIKPTLRVDGKLIPVETEPTTEENMTAVISQILTAEQQKRFASRNEMDLALSVAELGRFRVNLYQQRATTGVALRAVNSEIPSFEELNLPQKVADLCELLRGLIIVTGTTGSGKSTTLAAMIERVNSSRAENILTIEDPIEYVYNNKLSIISQREIGADTKGFSTALKQAFRQDPDVILIGEIRDAETMGIALAAADTGHLVLTTLHTLNTVETVSRIISFFPPHQHQQIRLLLAGTLEAIICQRLLPRNDTIGRVPAIEIMTSTGSIRDSIIDPLKTQSIIELIETGNVQYGMQSFDQSIMKLYRDGVISYKMAMQNATNPDDFDLRVKGITSASDGSWQGYAAPSIDDPV